MTYATTTSLSCDDDAEARGELEGLEGSRFANLWQVFSSLLCALAFLKLALVLDCFEELFLGFRHEIFLAHVVLVMFFLRL